MGRVLHHSLLKVQIQWREPSVWELRSPCEICVSSGFIKVMSSCAQLGQKDWSGLFQGTVPEAPFPSFTQVRKIIKVSLASVWGQLGHLRRLWWLLRTPQSSAWAEPRKWSCRPVLPKEGKKSQRNPCHLQSIGSYGFISDTERGKGSCLGL